MQNRGCQILSVKLTKMGGNIPHNQKIYQMALNMYTKWP
jgi:hypothetical protein